MPSFSTRKAGRSIRPFKLYPWEWMMRRGLRRSSSRLADKIRRAALEGGPVQQGHCRYCGRCLRTILICCRRFSMTIRRPQAGQFVCPQADLFARRRQYRTGQRRPLARPRTTGLMARKVMCGRRWAPLPSISDQYAVVGSWLVDHTPVRPVDPRGRESDHRQHVALPAARDRVARHDKRNGMKIRLSAPRQRPAGSAAPGSTHDPPPPVSPARRSDDISPRRSG